MKRADIRRDVFAAVWALRRLGVRTLDDDQMTRYALNLADRAAESYDRVMKEKKGKK